MEDVGQEPELLPRYKGWSRWERKAALLRDDPQETSGGKGLKGKAALQKSPVQVARLPHLPGAAASQTSSTRRWRWLPPGHHLGKQGGRRSDGQGQGRSPALRSALHPFWPGLMAPRTDVKRGAGLGAARPPAWGSPTRPLCALCKQRCLLQTPFPYL